MRTLIGSLALVVAVALTGTSARAQSPPPPSIQLSFDAAGTVNLAARSVTVREILAEWARQCGCYVVNADRLPGGPIPTPIQFEHAPQQAVLESLLRTAAGYALTPKRAGSFSVSNFETIYIVATSNPVAGTYTPPPTAPAMSMPTPGSPDDEIPPVTPGGFSRADTPQGSAAPPGMGPSPAPPQAAPPTPLSRVGGTPSSFVSVPIVPVNTPQGSTPAPGSATPGGVAPMPIPPQTPTPGR